MFGGGKYKLNFSKDGFESEKMKYDEGETVMVYFNRIASDTDYKFSLDCDDVQLNKDYDSTKGFVFTFVMPAHDVTLSVKAHHNMVKLQEAP